MKRLLPLAALAALMFIPVNGRAQTPICEQVQSLGPISAHYTKFVLERAQSGLDYARGAQTVTDFSTYLPNWTKAISTSAAQLVDTALRLNVQQQSLLQHSACLRLDLILIECKMDEVQREMRAQLERKSFFAIWQLQSLLRFLNERLRHLEKGALDPHYIDPTWGHLYLFDPPGINWCYKSTNGSCSQIPEAECSDAKGISFRTEAQCRTRSAEQPGSSSGEQNMCPFDADYSPPFINGFGCDLETMKPRLAYLPMKEEHAALSGALTIIGQFRGQAEEYLKLQKELDKAFGRGEDEEAEKGPMASGQSNSEPPPRKHLEAFGCGWSGGYCSADHTIRCLNDITCQNANKGTCEEPVKVCENNRIIRCFDDKGCSNRAKCVDDKAGAPAARSLRGSFSLNKDHLGILTEFLGIRTTQELSREFSSELKLPDEVEDPVKRKNLEERLRGSLEYGAILSSRLVRRLWSRPQGRQEASIFPQAVDAQLQIAHDLDPIRDAVGRLARLASKKEGLRTFIVRYAYFLRRTCIDRTCNKILEQILKLALEDECFPYTDGKFIADSEENPRWKICQDRAKIIPPVPPAGNRR